MTCEEFQSLRGVFSDFSAITPSLLVAGLRHMMECPKCKQIATKHTESQPPWFVGACSDAAKQMLPVIAERLKRDPEMGGGTTDEAADPEFRVFDRRRPGDGSTTDS